MSIKLKDTIYDLISNSDKLDGKDSSEFALAHSHPYLPYNILDSGNCSGLSEGLSSLKVADSTAGNTANHSAYLYIKSIGTPFQIQFPDSTDMYLYKRYYTSGAWSAWSKMKAGYADSAGTANSVAWGNISGKPSTFSPSSHDHDSAYLKLSGGTLSGKLGITDSNNGASITLDNTSGTSGNPCYIYYKVSGSVKASTGYFNGLAYLCNEVASGYPRIGISDTGNPEYWTAASSGSKYTLLHSGNYSTYCAPVHSHPYLPVAGGAMNATTGYISFSTGPSTNVTDSTPFAITYGKIQAAAPISIIADTDGTSTEYIIMTSGYTSANATKANGLAVGKNELTWKNSAILTAGNYSSTCDSRYVTKAGDNTMTGTLTMPLSGLNVGNNCSSDTNIYRAFRAYNSNLSTSYAGSSTIYACLGHTASAGNAAEYGFTYAGAASTSNAASMGFNAGNRLKLYYNGGSGVGTAKICSAISGGTEYTLLHEGNYSTWASTKGHTHDDRYFTESEINTKLGNYLLLSGGTMTGTLTAKSGGLVVNSDGGDTDTTRALKYYNTSATFSSMNVGYSASKGNAAEFAFYFISSASTSNFASIGFYGGNRLRLYYSGGSGVGRATLTDSNSLSGVTEHTILTSGNWSSYISIPSGGGSFNGGTITENLVIAKANPLCLGSYSNGDATIYSSTSGCWLRTYANGGSLLFENQAYDSTAETNATRNRPMILYYNTTNKSSHLILNMSPSASPETDSVFQCNGIARISTRLRIGSGVEAGDTRYICCQGKTGASYINWGYSDTSGNTGELSFTYVNSASSSNMVGIGFHSKNCIACYYDGRVNIPGTLQIGGETITFTT